MPNNNPKLTYMSIKAVQREYFPMFNTKTVRDMIKKNVPTMKLGNKILVKQSELENYLSSLDISHTDN